ncbi:MAG: dehypoxanthine futalosine cyclase [Deltaproteobacteria bacterium]|nr:MAG: dehypoxanthine futalosine cyclase [Deltaproteobacteria bacterium]
MIAPFAKRVDRLDFDEALELYQREALINLGLMANAMRQRFHPEPIVTYVVDRNINYTNVCCSGCAFCAFYRPKGHKEAYIISKEELSRKIEETLALGGTQVLLQGGMHPDLGLSYYEDLLGFIKENYQIHIHGLSPPEVHFLAVRERLPIEEILKRLINAGLGSIPGGGAEILVDRVRQIVSPNKCSAGQWLEVMETAHRMGLRTTATMVFGHVETMEERLEHLFKIRELQDRTGGFTAFIPWTFQPENTRLGGHKATSAEYLRMLAVSRLVLDNIPNIQASWVTQGPKIAQVALFFGANDLGSTMIEENVVAAAGTTFHMKMEEMVRLIETAGFVPQQRDTFYRPIHWRTYGAL